MLDCSPVTFVVIFVVNVLFCLFFLVLVIWSLYYLLIKGPRMRHWPSVQGDGIFTDVDSKSDRHGIMSYDVVIRYRYTVDGKTYESDRISPVGSSYGDHNRTLEVINELVRDGKVKVFYNPKKPANCYLDNRLRIGIALIGLAIAASLLACAIFFLLELVKGSP